MTAVDVPDSQGVKAVMVSGCSGCDLSIPLTRNSVNSEWAEWEGSLMTQLAQKTHTMFIY